jgi:hypothetical protein
MLKRKILSSYRIAHAVAELHGKSLPRQIAEIARIKRLNPTLGVSDYYWYRLYDAAFTSSTRAQDYLGWRVEDDVSQALNPRNLMMPAWDKFTFALYAKAYGLPIPKLHALFKPGSPLASDCDVEPLTTPDALSSWLRRRREWPLFAKPSCSRQSVGCYHFIGYDASADALFTSRGAKVPVPQFVAEVRDDSARPFFKSAMGYLFQEVLRPHTAIAELLGSKAISGVRIVLIQDAQGIEFVTAVWKMATGDNELDMFHGGDSGTFLANVDVATGEVGMTLDGWWPRAKLVDQIPASGRALDHFVLPCWNEVIALCRRAAGAFPLMRIQHWDVAITDRGPYLLEVNDFGALQVLQLFGKGLLTDRLRDLLRTSDDAATFPWIARLRA